MTLFRQHHLHLPEESLVENKENTVSMFILNKYRKDGIGLHSFIDKSDDQQYVYTKFEPDHCHYVFPCFD